jgi:hypothetical protein
VRVSLLNGEAGDILLHVGVVFDTEKNCLLWSLGMGKQGSSKNDIFLSWVRFCVQHVSCYDLLSLAAVGCVCEQLPASCSKG